MPHVVNSQVRHIDIDVLGNVKGLETDIEVANDLFKEAGLFAHAD